MTAAEGESPRYRLGPRSTRGLLAGWRTGQIACVGLGLLLAVGFLRALAGPAGALLALASAGGGVAVATWPVGGRTLEQWAPTVAAWGLRASAEARHRPWQALGRRPRGPLACLSIAELPGTGWAAPDGGRHAAGGTGGIGLIADAECATWTAVVPVGGNGFVLLGEAARAERIAAWGSVLSALARETSRLHRVQWLSTTYPAWLEGASPAGTGLESAAGAGKGRPGRHYARLLEEATALLWAHEVHVALSVRRRPGVRGSPDSGAALREQLGALDERLRGAGLSPGRPLSREALAAFVRRRFEVAPLATPVACPWPVGVDEAWARLRTDASWHASYWVAEWPRCEVGGGFLLPLLLEPALRRVVSVTMAPLAVAAAVRRAERDRTEATADAAMRHRHGFAVTARAEREQESRQRREAELAEGHAGYRYSGYVTVTGSDPLELEQACRRLEQAASLAQLELRRLYGAQEEGYCCTLPAGRGCR